MDSRFTDLKTVCAYEGLSDEERRHGINLLEGHAPPTVCYGYACLLRGALAERFNLLSDSVMTKNRGRQEGAGLLVKLLDDHKGEALSNDDVSRGLLGISRPGHTCETLLAAYLKYRRYLETRRQAA